MENPSEIGRGGRARSRGRARGRARGRGRGSGSVAPVTTGPPPPPRRVMTRGGIGGQRPSASSLTVNEVSGLPIAARQATLAVRQPRVLPSPTIYPPEIGAEQRVEEPVEEDPVDELEWLSSVPSPAAFVDCGESSGTSTPLSVHGSRKRVQPLQPTASQPRAKRSLPFDDVEAIFDQASTSAEPVARPSTSAEPVEVEPTPGPSWRPDPTPQATATPATSAPRRTTNLRPEDIQFYLQYMASDDEGSSGDEEEPLLEREEAVFRNCDAEDEVEIPETVQFREWPPRPDVVPPPPTEPTATPTIEPTATPTIEPSVVHEPLDKFNFEWKSFPSPAASPSSRREIFSERNVGPTANYATPYDAFTAIWDEQIMGHIAEETNRQALLLTEVDMASGNLAPNSRISRWKETNVGEMYTFFAVILAMGLMVKNVVQEYWTKATEELLSPGFASIMSYNRFLLLTKCLHFNDNLRCDRTLSNSDRKFFKVKPIVVYLNNKFSNLYNLSQNLAVDESLLMWKGWLNINQHIPDKAAKIGIKTYELCESKTGYTWRFMVHTGQDFTCPENAEPVSGTIPSLVLKLLEGLEGKGHTVWMDNFYNSPALARELKTRGFDCVGTLRTNRQFVPAELTNLTKNNMAVGSIYGCTSGDVDLLVWRDKNRVALISTYHGAEAVKVGVKYQPSIVPDYNISMGGVDRKDAMLSYYPIERKRTHVWYKKLFRRLLNVSVLNAYIMYRAHHKNTTHRQFRVTLMKQLLERHNTTRQIQAPREVHRHHFPGQYDITDGKGQEKGQRLWRLCVHCKAKRVTTYCIVCNKTLCLFTCFNDYDHDRNFGSLA